MNIWMGGFGGTFEGGSLGLSGRIWRVYLSLNDFIDPGPSQTFTRAALSTCERLESDFLSVTWRDPRTTRPIQKGKALPFSISTPSANNKDLVWLLERSSAKK